MHLLLTVTLCSPVLGWVKTSTPIETSPTASSTPEPRVTDTAAEQVSYASANSQCNGDMLTPRDTWLQAVCSIIRDFSMNRKTVYAVKGGRVLLQVEGYILRPSVLGVTEMTRVIYVMSLMCECLFSGLLESRKYVSHTHTKL